MAVAYKAPEAGYCECDNTPSRYYMCTTGCGKRHKRLSNYKLLKKDTASWN